MKAKKLLFLLVVLSIEVVNLPAQIINTIAGNYNDGYNGDGIPATNAELSLPYGVAVDDIGNVYIATSYYRIRKINLQGIINTIAGSGSNGYSGDGGPATAAGISRPIAVAADNSGNIYIADEDNNVIRKVNSAGVISTIAGGGNDTGTDGIGDGGPATGAFINDPRGITVDHFGNVYFADWNNNKIREINTSGIINAIAGNGPGYTGDGGPATSAKIYQPFGVAVDDTGNVYFGDAGNNRVRKINTSGIITTIAGNGSPTNYSGDGGPATSAELSSPFGVAVDDSMNVYICDFNHSCIREVYTSGIIKTVAGGGYAGPANGIPATASGMGYGYGVTVDHRQNIYFGDGAYNLARKVTISLDLALVTSNISCNGGSNGNASVTAYEVPSKPPYTYLWSPGGQTDTVISGLSSGTYTISVTDNNDSTYSTNVVITQPPVLTIKDSLLNLTCSGLSEGIASVTPSGGTVPYTYSWSAPNNHTTAIVTGLSAGTYSVTVSDSCGSSVTLSVIIPQNDTLKILGYITSPSCNGESNGKITATVIWGTSPFTYLWSDANSQTNVTATGLSAGSYVVQVTDTCGFTGTASFTVTQPNVLTVSPTVMSDLRCNEVNTGSVNANASGGTQLYSYVWEWNNGGRSTNGTLTGIAAGTYTIYVTDYNGCSATGTATITQPAVIASTFIINPITNCNGGTSGIISALAGAGAIPPFTYLWSDPNHQTSDTATGLSIGNYTVTITDNTGCSSFASNTFTLPNMLSDSVKIISSIGCNGGNTGSATVIVPWSRTVVQNYFFEPVVQHFLVPSGINTVSVNIGGARGGNLDSNFGGNGASFSGICPVTPGHILSVVVGQEGISNGGGGASWVYDSNIVLYNPVGNAGLLVVAAGGGGGGVTRSAGGPPHFFYFFGGAGGTNLASNSATYSSYGSDSTGSAGHGGAGSLGGGGAGWLSNGENGRPGITGGNDEANHFLAVSVYTGSYGGFGGGGANGIHTMMGSENNGGGGGGYNGGGAGQGGGGGGSYFINTSPIVTATDTGNGFVTISYTVGGIPPYTYLWSNGQTTDTATGLSAGIYTITVSDSSGCLLTASVTITQPSAITPTISLYSGITCNGDTDGVVFADATGGTGFYQYQWSGASSQTNSLATGLSTGTYSVTVTDNTGCSGTASISITQPPALSIIADSLSVTGTCNGSAWAVVSGGTNPYSYLWTGGLTTDTIKNQCGGDYCAIVTDANGCLDSTCVTINVTTGTNEEKGESEKVIVYPNPSNGIFTIQIVGTQNFVSPTMEVYNVLGEKVYFETLKPVRTVQPGGQVQGDYEINISSQPDGVYFYRVLQENGNLAGSGKIIIVK